MLDIGYPSSWSQKFRPAGWDRFPSLLDIMGADDEVIRSGLGDTLEGVYPGPFALIDLKRDRWYFTGKRLCSFCSHVRRSNGRIGCATSDASASVSAYHCSGPVAYICHAGMIDYVLPIIDHSAGKGITRVCATFIGGQYLPSAPDYKHVETSVAPRCSTPTEELIGSMHGAPTIAAGEVADVDKASLGGAWRLRSPESIKTALNEVSRVLSEKTNGRVSFAEGDVDRLVAILQRESGAKGVFSRFPEFKGSVWGVVRNRRINHCEAWFGDVKDQEDSPDGRVTGVAAAVFDPPIFDMGVQVFDCPSGEPSLDLMRRLRVFPLSDTKTSRDYRNIIQNSEKCIGGFGLVEPEDWDELPAASLADRSLTAVGGGGALYACLAFNAKNPGSITFQADAVRNPEVDVKTDGDMAFRGLEDKAGELSAVLEAFSKRSAGVVLPKWEEILEASEALMMSSGEFDCDRIKEVLRRHIDSLSEFRTKTKTREFELGSSLTRCLLRLDNRERVSAADLRRMFGMVSFGVRGGNGNRSLLQRVEIEKHIHAATERVDCGVVV